MSWPASERRAAATAVGVDRLVFDPFLVRGMGYYTGPIFELAHPSVDYSLGGGGRYDGMIGRFLGSEVPATGFSLGFERLVELVDLPASEQDVAVALVHDADVPLASLFALQRGLVAGGQRVRLVRRPKNLKPALDALAADGFTLWASVDASTTPESIELRVLGLPPRMSVRLILSLLSLVALLAGCAAQSAPTDQLRDTAAPHRGRIGYRTPPPAGWRTRSPGVQKCSALLSGRRLDPSPRRRCRPEPQRGGSSRVGARVRLHTPASDSPFRRLSLRPGVRPAGKPTCRTLSVRSTSGARLCHLSGVTPTLGPARSPIEVAALSVHRPVGVDCPWAPAGGSTSASAYR